MQKIYVGVNGTPREVVKVLVGVNGTPREVTQVYVGSNGTPRLSYQNKTKAGEKVFTSSGNFTVPKGINKIDIFCVGGGGYGGYGFTMSNVQFNYEGRGGSGGGGGYTRTDLGVPVSALSSLNITVGSGGSSSIVKSGSSILCQADGGKNGENPAPGVGIIKCVGGSGGSGGGAGGCGDNLANGAAHKVTGGKGGSNGSDGSSVFQYWYNSKLNYELVAGGKGQGSNTRYFGESNGTLYAGGGGGGAGVIGSQIGGLGGAGGGGAGFNTNGEAGAANTGGGGGGAPGTGNVTGIGAGGSGVVIIRWPDEA